MKVVDKILVIRHGALGDFAMATGAMKAIRARYPQAKITLLTQSFLVDFGKHLGFFDEVLVDNRSRSPLAVWTTLRLITRGRYDFVYDLQGTHRTRRTYRFGARLFGYRGKWSAVGDRDFEIGFPKPDLSMLHGENAHFGLLPSRFALLIPGCGPRNPEKRWPAANYRALTAHLSERGLVSVVLGTKAEAAEVDVICRDNPNAVSFMGLSSLADIPDLARRAEIVVGNDTGPTHLCRLTGIRTILLLLTKYPHLAKNTNTQRTLVSEDIGDISLDLVVSASEEMLRNA